MITSAIIVQPPMITTMSASMGQAMMIPNAMNMQAAALNVETQSFRMSSLWSKPTSLIARRDGEIPDIKPRPRLDPGIDRIPDNGSGGNPDRGTVDSGGRGNIVDDGASWGDDDGGANYGNDILFRSILDFLSFLITEQGIPVST